MKSRTLSMILLAASAAACAPSAPAAAPAPEPAPRAEPADVPPVLALLSERERLSLTAAQVAALDSIAREWDVVNEKLHRRVGVARGNRPPAFALALRPGAKPTLSAIAENNRRAADAVRQVLAPEQRQAVCAPAPSGQGSSTGVEAGKAARLTRALGLRSSEPGRGSRASTRTQASRTWPWCQPASGGTLAQSRR